MSSAANLIPDSLLHEFRLPLVSLDGHSHSVQFYGQDSSLIDSLSQTIGAALVSGNSAIVIATKEHRDGLSASLRTLGLDPGPAIRQGRFLVLDAAETLAQFMAGGLPDPILFTRLMGDRIDQLAAAARTGSPQVTAFGEMVALLWAEGRREAAIRLEQLWNDLGATHSFRLHCAYPIDLFPEEVDARHIQQICAEHSNVIPAEQYTSAASDIERLQAIVVLQQKARALETEIQERRRAEEGLFRLAAIVESSDDAIIGKDLNGIINSWNRSAQRIFGYTAQEMAGKPVTLLIPPELQAEEQNILAKLRAGERIEHFQTVRLAKNGDRLDVSLTISPVRDRNGNIIGAAKILRDITQQKKREAALHTTEKLASVGRLAATVAHEINNPLESVINFVYLARQQADLCEETRSYLTFADQELARVAHIAQQTLGFYRDNSRPVLVSLSTAVDDVLAIYESRCRTKGLRVERRIQAGLTLHTAQGELKQILSNLIANAIDASSQFGRLVIACRHASRQSDGTAGVCITIADTGSGVSDSDKERLFIPFFTTKEAVGTGLGLWITKDLLEKRGGSIRFRSRNEPGCSGTVMRIFLPLSHPVPAQG